jgi:cell wall-associated NlpC family hydrolase
MSQEQLAPLRRFDVTITCPSRGWQENVTVEATGEGEAQPAAIAATTLPLTGEWIQFAVRELRDDARPNGPPRESPTGMRRGLVRAVFARVGRAFALALLVTLMGAGSVLAETTASDGPPPAPAVAVPSAPGLFRPIVGPAGPGIATERARGEQVGAAALKQVGAPYRWSGITPAGFDCSGLVAFVYETVGITLPRDVIGQVATGRRVEPSTLLPGDILVFRDTYKPGPSHTGIALGDGRFVHAADERRGVIISALSDHHWGPRLHSARRPAS